VNGGPDASCVRKNVTSTVSRTVLRIVAAAFVLAAAVVVLYVVNIVVGMRVHARTSGTLAGLAVYRPVEIIRDSRGVPHITAQNEHDLFFAQGYAEASDRLFQMDLLRRFVTGRLAEILGRAALTSDEKERAIPVASMAEAQWRALDSQSRELLGAFTDGVNAAIDLEPLPVEFRILSYKPQPWTPLDTLAVSMATVVDLTDDWNDVAPRDRAFRSGGEALFNARFPLTDPCYDAPVTAGLSHIGPGPECRSRVALLGSLAGSRQPIGSNEWAAGANHSLTHRALIANDPHLGLRMPGVWYLVDLRAPGFHAAGATFPGAPGVILGHNDRLAWAATNGTVTSLSVFERPKYLYPRDWQTETFTVRFARKPVTQSYYRANREFGITTNDGRFVLVRWNFYTHPISPAQTFLMLDRAQSIEAAVAALRTYPGPTQNFALADTSGRVAYELAGTIPNDPLWARRFHPASDLTQSYPAIPFAELPHVAASRDAIVWTANNKIYAGGYPLRLSSNFEPPYRAYRIAQLLRARKTYDVAYFTQMQLDVLSNPERDLARALAPSLRAVDPNVAAALAGWDGEMRGDSTTATIAERLRLTLTDRWKQRTPTLLSQIPHHDDDDADVRTIVTTSPQPWSQAGAVPVRHAFAALGMSFLNGVTLPGNGDTFTVHVQAHDERGGGYYSQSFRAVWDVGNWDSGGISIPQGESGEPGSKHYTDEVAAWLEGRLQPLPYSEAAVERAAVQREVLSR
jgi:penicillin G amidase